MAVEGNDSPMNFLGFLQELWVGAVLRRRGDESGYSQQKGCAECRSKLRAPHFYFSSSETFGSQDRPVRTLDSESLCETRQAHLCSCRDLSRLQRNPRKST